MRWIFIVVAILTVLQVGAQRKTIVRVYDLVGKKIGRGEVLVVSDSILTLKNKTSTKEVHLQEIGVIKAGRPSGKNIWIGALAGAGIGGIVAGVTHKPSEDAYLKSSRTQDILAGSLLIGAPVGAAVGGLTVLFKRKKTFTINADPQNWQVFQEYITERMME